MRSTPDNTTTPDIRLLAVDMRLVRGSCAVGVDRNFLSSTHGGNRHVMLGVYCLQGKK